MVMSTDLWKGHRPLMDQYNISQIESHGGLNFKALHTIIHQVKSWLRTTYSRVSKFHINRYLDEFCYRINHSQMKENIFFNNIPQMVAAGKIYQTCLIGR
jgi:ISXO2 transposase-like protein